MSIIKRIYLGMGAMIFVILGVGAFAVFQTKNLAGTFVDYRGTARTSLVATNITEDLYEARLASSKFRLTGDPSYLTEMTETYRRLLRIFRPSQR